MEVWHQDSGDIGVNKVDERKQLTMYESMFKAIRRIKKKADRCDAYDAVLSYGFYQTIPDLESLPDSAAIAFDLIRPIFDSARKKAESGKQGGSKPKANRKQTEREKEGEEEKEGEIEIENECYIESANADSSAEPKNKEPKEPAVIMLPLNDGTEYGITESQIKQWQSLYPSVDVIQQLRNMRGWLDAKPSRRKTRRGINAFCASWLSKEQDRGGTNGGGGYYQKKKPVPMGCTGLGEAELEAIQRALREEPEEI